MNNNLILNSSKEKLVKTLQASIIIAILGISADIFDVISGVKEYFLPAEPILKYDVRIPVKESLHKELNGTFLLTVDYKKSDFKCFGDININEKIYEISKNTFQETVIQHYRMTKSTDFRYNIKYEVQSKVTDNLKRSVCDETDIKASYANYHFQR